ncbi:unnamed protein product [Caenorhabditis auriculariae]|uniref:One cut domain family member n=1 Tax=Caenorhabditis auriculariae TaxID=2777116 RepID=A0A8S1HS34_9PELO|nr:unnamed protein product [Caenorhabditis auriculariae]
MYGSPDKKDSLIRENKRAFPDVMEPPAATTCSSQSSSANGSEKQRQNADYLQIDPSSTFLSNTARNGYEELPENFLDTISPHPTTPQVGHVVSEAPQLAPLTPMSISSDPKISYSSMMSIGSQFSDRHLDKSSPAGLLSPLHLERRPAHEFSRHQQSHVYIKEENEEPHLLLTSMSQQQEMDRAQAETPPAVSNVELASTMIATLIGGEPGEDSPSPHAFSTSQALLQQQLDSIKDEEDLDHVNGSDHLDYQSKHIHSYKPPRRVYSTQDSSDPLNAEIDNDIYIDTKELCRRIAYELKQHSIPQATFAERILCRSQGTLSDLLRNPKPWNKLKSGRETFRRMFNWVQQPLATRLAILDMIKTDGDEGASSRTISGLSPPTPAQNVRQARRSISDPDAPNSKRPRLVFTDIQKRTLQAIFKETQRPSREMQQTIAEHLRLDLSTVANFFMNARRRSRIGPGGDEPAPYQQVHPVSPPPSGSPPGMNGASGADAIAQAASSLRRLRQHATLQHVEATVSSVAESAIQYSRTQATNDDFKLYKLSDDPLAGESGLSIEDSVGYENDLTSALTPLAEDSVSNNDGPTIKEEQLDEQETVVDAIKTS